MLILIASTGFLLFSDIMDRGNDNTIAHFQQRIFLQPRVPKKNYSKFCIKKPNELPHKKNYISLNEKIRIYSPLPNQAEPFHQFLINLHGLSELCLPRSTAIIWAGSCTTGSD